MNPLATLMQHRLHTTYGECFLYVVEQGYYFQYKKDKLVKELILPFNFGQADITAFFKAEEAKDKKDNPEPAKDYAEEPAPKPKRKQKSKPAAAKSAGKGDAAE